MTTVRRQLQPSINLFRRRLVATRKPTRPIPARATSDISFSPNSEYRRLIVETSQALSESLLRPVPRPEQFDLIDLMQDVGDNLGYKVEISQGRVMVRAKAGVRHQHAQFSLSHNIFEEKDWLILTELHVKLPCGSNRQPIAGWKKPVQLDLAASTVEQRPDWVCEILSPGNKEDDLPGGDKFREYEASRIPYYWIVDPVVGQILVYELRVDEYMQIHKVTLLLDKACILDPFRRQLELDVVFWFLIQND